MIVFGVHIEKYDGNLRNVLERVAKADSSVGGPFNFIVAKMHDRSKSVGDEDFSVDASSLRCSEWSTRVLAYSGHSCLTKVPESTRLVEDLQMSNFLGLKAMIIEIYRFADLDFIKTLKQLCSRPLATSRYQSLWLKVDFWEGEVESVSCRPWTEWNRVRHLTDHDPQIGVVLDLSDLSYINYGNITLNDIQFQVNRWIAEPIKAIYVPLELFVYNEDSYPVLSVENQAIVGKLLGLSNIHVILYRRDSPREEADASPKRMRVAGQSELINERDPEVYKNCAAYLRYLHNKVTEESLLKVINVDSNYGDSTVDKATAARRYFSSLATFRDTLQAPLQPLIDNLESETYETFERDLFKYTQYEEAVYRAVQRLLSHNRGLPLRIAIVGAGRGPLVDTCLRALMRVLEPIFVSRLGGVRIFAVEKNENAVQVLRRRLGKPDDDYTQCTYPHHKENKKADLWNPTLVTVVHADMRDWRPKEEDKADILVSELLGSFGDNELSPECLDRANHCIKSRDSISIPASYTSYLAPVANSKAWAQARDVLAGNGLHTPLVVNQHAYFQMAEAHAVFTFSHPRPSSGNDEVLDIERNNRSVLVSFGELGKGKDVTMHGFIGFFEAVLYEDKEGGDVMLSTNPATCTSFMTSWFPIFFPLEVPLTVRGDQGVSAQLWRCVSEKQRKVWYEWCLSHPAPTKIQNVGGTRYSLGLD